MLKNICTSETCAQRKLCMRNIYYKDVMANSGVIIKYTNRHDYSKEYYQLVTAINGELFFERRPIECSKRNQYIKMIPIKNLEKGEKYDDYL